MTISEFLLADFNREVERSRWALERVPDNQYDWKPHDRSMLLGYLTDMIATIPSWVTSILTEDSIDIAPVGGSKMKPERKTTSKALLKALDETAAAARDAFARTTDEHLATKWQLKVAGNVVQESPRHEALVDTINHWVHHRGQLTVYLRLMGEKVPAIYGPSADDNNFR